MYLCTSPICCCDQCLSDPSCVSVCWLSVREHGSPLVIVSSPHSMRAFSVYARRARGRAPGVCASVYNSHLRVYVSWLSILRRPCAMARPETRQDINVTSNQAFKLQATSLTNFELETFARRVMKLGRTLLMHHGDETRPSSGLEYSGARVRGVVLGPRRPSCLVAMSGKIGVQR